MKPRSIGPRVSWVGAIDWDSRLFDSLVPLPDGTSYNSYVVEGSEKTALIDTVEPGFADNLLERISGFERIDFLVSLHAEQDHSGSIPVVLERFPEAKVLVSAKGRDMLIDLLGVAEDRLLTVADGEEVSLGDRTLRFLYTPWVHWPETMSAFLVEEGVLFPCDLFGSHLATSDLFGRDEGRVLEAAKRYYAEIMMPFAKSIRKHLKKFGDLDIRTIAPSHGPVHDRPEQILDAYGRWVSPEPGNLAVVAYVSMHHSTRTMVDHLIGELIDRGVEVEQFNLVVTDIGKLAMSLVDAATIVIGTPVVLNGPHPLAVHAAYLANMLKPKARFVSVVGSYGWKGKTAEILLDLMPNLKAELLDPVMIRGRPTAEHLADLTRLADDIASRHAALDPMGGTK